MTPTTTMQIQNNRIIDNQWKFYFIDDGNYRINPPGSSLRDKTSYNKLDLQIHTFNISFLYVESPLGSFLVDLGIGSLPNSFFTRIDKDAYVPIKDKMQKLTGNPIKAILLSHLHIDHIGNYLEYADNNYFENFPDIPCYISKKEWDFRTSRIPKADDVYKKYYHALEKNARFTSENEEIIPGIKIKYIGGHTPGHQVFLFYTEHFTVCYAGDLIATETQLSKNRPLPFDFDSDYACELRGKILNEGRENQWIFAMNHAPHVKFKLLEKAEKNL